MKSIVITVSALLLLAGCTSQPVALKANNTYFTPARVTASKATTAKGASRVTNLTTAQKKINEKDTMIELLRKENKELRERIQRLERKLQIQNS